MPIKCLPFEPKCMCYKMSQPKILYKYFVDILNFFWKLLIKGKNTNIEHDLDLIFFFMDQGPRIESRRCLSYIWFASYK